MSRPQNQTGHARVRLGVWPTAIHQEDRLGSVLGASEGDVWIKRDDLSGFSWGGNKVRSIEFLLGSALAEEATDIVLAGGPSSNFAALMAAGARAVGLNVHQFSYEEEPDTPVAGLTFGRQMGATVFFTGSDDRSEMETAAESYGAQLMSEGARPYLVPRGGASTVGALGFYAAAQELQAQAGPEMPTTIVLPLGSGGSTAGLVAGLCGSDRPWRVHAVSVSRDPASFKGAIVDKAVACAALYGVAIDQTEVDQRLEVHDGRDPGFARTTSEQRELMADVTATTGLLVDPTYNSKALFWLRAAISAGRFSGHPVLYWNTGGALGAIDHMGSLGRTSTT